ncbi:TetR/AcrR family transcriptional regulator [Actinopolyspora mortivallis]|uniref:TetR/AcrR family transcriptional regulator n=1 Tax=Actinopolyspora mortivallis TaxID=33906 RepID=UPI000A04F63C|nr:TetR/AcrR family transcriptional regulator [Actinopolyspora mortivallis]
MSPTDRSNAIDEESLTPAAAKVLECASDLFYREGIRAVGVEAIAEAAGVTKKTLYDRFGSKEELVAAYLRVRDRRWRDFLTRYVDSHAVTPQERILVVFDALESWMAGEDPRGCGFVNAHVELTDETHPGRAVITSQKQWFLNYLNELCTQAGLHNSGDAAGRLLLIHEGATVTNSMNSVENSANKAKDLAATIVRDELTSTQYTSTG